MSRDTRARSPREWLRFAFATVIVAAMFYPSVWMFYSAFKSNREIFRAPYALPTEWRWQNLVDAWVKGGLGDLYLNSLIVTAVSVSLAVFLATAAAYGFARLQFPGRDLLYRVLLIGLLLPPPAIAIALFTQLRDMSLLDTRWALILPYSAWSLALTVYLMRSYFMTIRPEMEEAAHLDGANAIHIFWHIALPMVRPAMFTMVILNTINIWNELLFALLFISDDALRTLPAGIIRFFGHHSVNYSLVFAALTITTVPILIVYFFFQRHVIRGLTAAALD